MSAEVANLLPVGSRVECNKCKCNPGDYHEKTNERWPWVNYVLGQRSGQFDKWPSHGIEEVTITRIGPAPATTDVPDKAESPIEMHINTRGCGEPLNTKTIEALGEMGRAALGIHTNGQQPDKAEEIAREICECGDMDSDSWTKFAAGVLRKHHVGQPTPLADLIADPRLRPVVEVVKAALQLIESCNRNDAFMFEANGAPDFINKAVDALPPELRAAVEGVK